MEDESEISYLRRRVRELEEKIEQLRLSRRVLMSLIERLEKEKASFLGRLEKENRKLHRDNYRYAWWLLRKNQRIVELESKLQDCNSQDSAN
jgi:predicted RNase H-like nuclease (RuvC/YqgF family)